MQRRSPTSSFAQRSTHIGTKQRSTQSGLSACFSMLKRAAAGETDHAVRSVVTEAHRLVKHIDRSALLDTALAATATQVEHIEIALYGGMVSISRVLGLTEISSVLEQTLAEEKAANEKFTEVAVASLNPAAVKFHNSLHFYPII